MSKVDQFESQFRAAAKPVFHWAPPEVKRVLLVSDRLRDGAEELLASLRSLFGESLPGVEWSATETGDFGDVASLLSLVNDRDPDLVITYRHLHSDGWRYQFSLGEYVDVLAQVATCPVLLIPHPDREDAWPLPNRIENVMAITDHLAGEERLVNWAARFVPNEGALHLTHVEDSQTFARFVDVISKLPDIDTESASKSIQDQMLKEARDYIERCRAVFQENGVQFRVESEVVLGCRLREYERLVQSHQTDLLVMSTRDDDQLAMHGVAYPLTIELRDIPLLLL